MLPIFLAAATAVPTIQCNTVDNVGGVAPYEIELGLADDRPSLTMRKIDPVAPPIIIAGVTSKFPANPLAELDFDATINLVTYAVSFRQTYTGAGERQWLLSVRGKDGPTRRLTQMLGICGDGFRLARSGQQPEIKGHALTCYAVMVSGRMFSFTYDFMPNNQGVMTSSDKSLWQSGSATMSAFGPKGPELGDVIIDFSSIDPIGSSDGPTGYKVLTVNKTSWFASYEFNLLNIEKKASQNGMKHDVAVALCRELRFAPPK